MALSLHKTAPAPPACPVCAREIAASLVGWDRRCGRCRARCERCGDLGERPEWRARTRARQVLATVGGALAGLLVALPVAFLDVTFSLWGAPPTSPGFLTLTLAGAAAGWVLSTLASTADPTRRAGPRLACRSCAHFWSVG